jgi:hypothetical protein
MERKFPAAINNDVLNSARAVTPKPLPPATSWWTEARTRDEFSARRATEQRRMDGATEKDAKPNV